MRTGAKFVNTDILKAMQIIVDGHVKHYQSDFDIDAESIKEAALKKERTERIFVWLCRECGTWLLRKKDVFIQGTRENNTFNFYAEQKYKDILCYVVEVRTLDRDVVMGNLYSLDYSEHYRHVQTAAVSAGNIIVAYEKGERILPPTAHFGAYPDYELGRFVSYKFVPESQEQLETVLLNEKRNRQQFREDYEILSYELYEYPKSPTENGKYYGKTPVLEQAECIVRNAEEAGQRLFIKAVCSDGKMRYI